MTILVTGGAGFIGSNFVLDWLANPKAESVVNLDKLTYAGNLGNLEVVQNDARHHFVHGDIGDVDLIEKVLREHAIRAVVNFAAESHVDRSIHGPGEFIHTNVVGTFHLLESVRAYWTNLAEPQKHPFVSCMSRPMRSMAHFLQRILLFRRPIPTSPIVRTRLPKRLRII